jgi:hypothetical protein
MRSPFSAGFLNIKPVPAAFRSVITPVTGYISVENLWADFILLKVFNVKVQVLFAFSPLTLSNSSE